VDASFTYDALGRRVSKTIAGTGTQFLYDGPNPVQELQGGAPSASLLTGRRLDEYFRRTDSSSNVSTMLQDGLGSAIGLVGSGQSIATSYTYQPFGGTTATGASNGNSYQFTGRENDDTGLYYYRARYYSPTLQRFIAQDPIGFRGGDANLYGYTGEDPVNEIDPLGLCWLQGNASFVLGGGVTIGYYNGQFFVEVEGDVGIGGGATLSPTGQIPGFSPTDTPAPGCYNVPNTGPAVDVTVGPISTTVPIDWPLSPDSPTLTPPEWGGDLGVTLANIGEVCVSPSIWNYF
jgi:RHS repeat-associated protein